MVGGGLVVIFLVWRLYILDWDVRGRRIFFHVYEGGDGGRKDLFWSAHLHLAYCTILSERRVGRVLFILADTLLLLLRRGWFIQAFQRIPIHFIRNVVEVANA